MSITGDIAVYLEARLEHEAHDLFGNLMSAYPDFKEGPMKAADLDQRVNLMGIHYRLLEQMSEFLEDKLQNLALDLQREIVAVLQRDLEASKDQGVRMDTQAHVLLMLRLMLNDKVKADLLKVMRVQQRLAVWMLEQLGWSKQVEPEHIKWTGTKSEFARMCSDEYIEDKERRKRGEEGKYTSLADCVRKLFEHCDFPNDKEWEGWSDKHALDLAYK